MKNRIDNWTTIHAQNIEKWRRLPFDWAAWNCCHLAAEHVLSMTGVDYRERFPAYTSQEEAEAILAAHCGMIGLVSQVLGAHKPWTCAMRADIIVADFGHGLAAGVCDGVFSFAPGPRGLIFRPTAIAVAAWTV